MSSATNTASARCDLDVDAVEIAAASLPVDAQIKLFLAGDTSGRALLEMLYGSVDEEPVPERFLALLRRPIPRLVSG
jgi:hypothetical protein